MKEKYIIIIALFFGLLVVATGKNAREFQEKKPSLIPPKIIDKFTFGYADSMADSLWLRVIQDFGFCEDGASFQDDRDLVREKSYEKNLDLESKSEQLSLEEKVHDKGMNFFDALEEEELVRSSCRFGWVFQMVDRITDLSPYFLIAYRMGATILSVIVNDRHGAAKIFDKGIRRFPKDWSLAYRAAYHQLYEMRNYKKAAVLMHLAADNGAPIWVRNLAATIYQKTGQLFLVKSVLLDLVEKSKGNKVVHENAKKRLEKLNILIKKEKYKYKKEK